MKKEIVTLFLMTSVWAAQAQGTFTIEGQVKNVEDGALITLFRLDGNVVAVSVLIRFVTDIFVFRQKHWGTKQK